MAIRTIDPDIRFEERDETWQGCGVRGRQSGDGFVRCGDGHVRWGRFGAAGVVFVTSRDSGAHVMLQLRSGFAHEGGTWSCAGGALDEGEQPYEGALREAAEEVGAVPAGHRLVGQYVFAPSTDWTYTTMVIEVGETFGESVNFETDAIAWVHIDHVDRKALHPGFAAAWPQLREIIAANDSDSTDRAR